MQQYNDDVLSHRLSHHRQALEHYSVIPPKVTASIHHHRSITDTLIETYAGELPTIILAYYFCTGLLNLWSALHPGSIHITLLESISPSSCNIHPIKSKNVLHAICGDTTMQQLTTNNLVYATMLFSQWRPSPMPRMTSFIWSHGHHDTTSREGIFSNWCDNHPNIFLLAGSPSVAYLCYYTFK